MKFVKDAKDDDFFSKQDNPIRKVINDSVIKLPLKEEKEKFCAMGKC